MFWAFAQICLFCECGERLSDQYNDIDIKLFQSNWYTFPKDIQKLIPILLNGTKRPAVLRGIGNIILKRKAFKNVRHFN